MSRSAIASYPGVQVGYEARSAAAASIVPSTVWPLNWWHALHCALRPHHLAVAGRTCWAERNVQRPRWYNTEVRCIDGTIKF